MRGEAIRLCRPDWRRMSAMRHELSCFVMRCHVPPCPCGYSAVLFLHIVPSVAFGSAPFRPRRRQTLFARVSRVRARARPRRAPARFARLIARVAEGARLLRRRLPDSHVGFRWLRIACPQPSPRPPSRGPALVFAAASAVGPVLHRLRRHRVSGMGPRLRGGDEWGAKACPARLASSPDTGRHEMCESGSRRRGGSWKTPCIVS